MRTNHKWMIMGFLAAFAMSSLASLPRTGTMALTPEVSEIKLKRQQELTYDQDLKRLSQLQGRYKENLPYKKRAALNKKVATKKGSKVKKTRPAPTAEL